MIKSTTIVFAAVMISSGLCLSEAFGTGSNAFQNQKPFPRQRPRLYGGLKYAEDSNVDSQPKRRKLGKAAVVNAKKPRSPSRKRVRSAASTTYWTAGETDTGNTTAFEGGKTRKPKEQVQARNLDGIHMTTDILDHGLLTKQEEQVLALQIRRAIQMREAVTAWAEAQKMSQSPKSFGEEKEDWISIYGTPTQQAMERYFYEDREENAAEELYFQDGSPFDGDLSGFSEVYPTTASQQRFKPSSSWMEELLQEPQRDKLHWLTDEDVRTLLNLSGGRAQLKQILLEGALARQRLMKCNIRLVSSIAKRWAPTKTSRGEGSIANIFQDYWNRPSLDELIQEGVFGLAEAAERFDPDRGLRFTTYATFWITNFVRKKFQSESTAGMQLPASYYEMKRKYILAVREYLQRNEQPPSVEMLADEMGVSVKRLVRALQLTQPLKSLDSGRSASQGSGAGKAGGTDPAVADYTIGDMIPCEEPQPEDHVERSFLRQCLENAMATELSPNERDVVRMRLGLDDGVVRSAEEVADVCGGRLKASGEPYRRYFGVV